MFIFNSTIIIVDKFKMCTGSESNFSNINAIILLEGIIK